MDARRGRARHRDDRDPRTAGRKTIEHLLDKPQLVKVFLGFRVRRVDHPDVGLVLLRRGIDACVEARALVQIRLAVAAQDHVRRSERVHARVLLNADKAVLLDVLDLGLRGRSLDHLDHRRDEEAARARADIEDLVILGGIGNEGEQFGDVLWSEHDAQALAVAAGVLQELSVERADNVEVVVDREERHHLLGEQGHDLVEQALRVALRGLAQLGVNLDAREGLGHVLELCDREIRLVDDLLN